MSKVGLLKTNSNFAAVLRLRKNGAKMELYFKEKEEYDVWIQKLKNFVVLSNFHDVYEATAELGRGAFSRVYLTVSRKNGSEYAVKALGKKQLMRSENGVQSLKNEIRIMMSISHPGICQLYEVYESDGSIYMVMEAARGGCLMRKIDYTPEYSEEKAQSVIGDLLRILAMLHEKGIAHRDLKPGNILLTEKGPMATLKLVDFGFAHNFNSTSEIIYPRCGTPGYLAPEIFDEKVIITTKVDMFAVGVILYCVLTSGFVPFHDKEAKQVLRKNSACIVDFNCPQLSHVSEEGKDLLKRLLERDPVKRISAVDALKHNFFFSGRISHSPSPLIRRMKNPLEIEPKMDRMKVHKLDLYFQMKLKSTNQLDGADVGTKLCLVMKIKDSQQYIDNSLDNINRNSIQSVGSPPNHNDTTRYQASSEDERKLSSDHQTDEEEKVTRRKRVGSVSYLTSREKQNFSRTHAPLKFSNFASNRMPLKISLLRHDVESPDPSDVGNDSNEEGIDTGQMEMFKTCVTPSKSKHSRFKSIIS
eukprot:TRINITY_DN11451_c0_g1_i1.p1 TRINITY_DN11451_c0_g1~~TRINITY_DN11451_c0_g1_i1.p1  ORF type:complete len:530 (+),score=83.11 TRINITY_DN11451_c0_g1_i1:266-1855(+)